MPLHQIEWLSTILRTIQCVKSPAVATSALVQVTAWHPGIKTTLSLNWFRLFGNHILACGSMITLTRTCFVLHYAICCIDELASKLVIESKRTWIHHRVAQKTQTNNKGPLRTLIASFMGPAWGPSGADMTQLGPMLTPWTLLSWWASVRDFV